MTMRTGYSKLSIFCARRKPTETMSDKLLILEDTDGDGKADKCSVFADGLHNPTGFEFVGKGVLIAQAPDIVYLEDTDGDGKADVRKRVLSGFDTADTRPRISSGVTSCSIVLLITTLTASNIPESSSMNTDR